MYVLYSFTLMTCRHDATERANLLLMPSSSKGAQGEVYKRIRNTHLIDKKFMDHESRTEYFLPLGNFVILNFVNPNSLPNMYEIRGEGD